MPEYFSNNRRAENTDSTLHYYYGFKNNESKDSVPATEEALSELKDTIPTSETRTDTRPSLPTLAKNKDKPEINDVSSEVMEIFGNDKETMKHYVDGVRAAMRRMREALETPRSKDPLHDFITTNGSYKRNSFRRLNADWQAMLKFTPNEEYKGPNAKITKMRIVAASQLYMVEYFKTHVFKSKQSVDLNPWNFVDGKTGPHTVSVYSAYWNTEHMPKSARPETESAQLEAEYSPEAKISYKQAGDKLARIIPKIEDRRPSVPKPPDPEHKPVDTLLKGLDLK